MSAKANQRGVFCLSFDAVALSGLIVEFLKIASLFHQHDYAIFLDLGYEIKADKHNFFKAYVDEKDKLPAWVNLVKVIDQPFDLYTCEYIQHIFTLATQHPEQLDGEKITIKRLTHHIANELVKLWTKHNIQIVIIENGTLPENIIFTQALYQAIEVYGNALQLKRFVLWRDHDLMWSSESYLEKYGKAPFHHIPKPLPSPHITHVVLHETDLHALKKWHPEGNAHVLPNTFSPSQLSHTEEFMIRKSLRANFEIPQEAYLLARITRIIPQKRIDRDIELIAYLNKLSDNAVYLIIAGSPHENTEEWGRLIALIQQLNVGEYVKFVGDATPFHSDASTQLISIRNLLIACDLCSFLTSYNYESFGNPLSEAISLKRAYITTHYERYTYTYQQLGYRGLIFPISANEDGNITLDFAKKVHAYLQDTATRAAHVSCNLKIMQQHSQNTPSLLTLLTSYLDVTLC